MNDKNKENIYIGKSVGASGKNYPVKLPEGGHAKFAEGTEITDIKVFAGKGTDIPIKNAKFLESDYGVPADEWEKVRGTAYINSNGKNRKAEVHWYEGGNQKVQFKVKRYYDDES